MKNNDHIVINGITYTKLVNCKESTTDTGSVKGIVSHIPFIIMIIITMWFLIETFTSLINYLNGSRNKGERSTHIYLCLIAVLWFILVITMYCSLVIFK